MPIIIDNESNSSRPKKTTYEKVSEGIHDFEIFSVKEVTVDTDRGPIRKIQFIFGCTDEFDADGSNRSIVHRFTRSLYENSRLSAFLRAIDVTKLVGDLAKFDLEELRFATFKGIVQWNTDEALNTWVNITAGIPGTLKILKAEERAAKLAAWKAQSKPAPNGGVPRAQIPPEDF